MVTSISKKREELKLRIEAIKYNNLPALFFKATDHSIRLVSRRNKPLPLWYIVLFLAVLIQLPTLMIVRSFQEYSQWNVLGVTWVGFLELGLISPIMTYYLILYLAREMNTSLIDLLQNSHDLIELKISLDNLWNIKRYWLNLLLFGVIWSVSFTGISSIYLKRFIGFGLASGTIVFGFVAGLGWIYLPWFIQFSNKLGQYEFKLFDLDPARSEFVVHVKSFYNQFTYSIMGYFLLATIANAFNVWAELFIVIIAWIPAILLFVVYQTSLQRIIKRAKWRYLNKLQAQMIGLSKKNLSEGNSMETVNRLMDFHERIRLTPNSAIDLRSILSFLNQLMLPILGLLLANYEKIINFFK